ncbi:MAG TPA: LemA family protein [Tepidisphaeraceae bacterium]|nr:LemA family protein [Tepidisphaeraceae bacterium]
MLPYVVVALLLAGFVVVLVVLTYNKLILLRNRFQNSFAQIDVQLKRRYDLIPNLVEAVKGYMTHERATLDAVTSARNQAMAAAQSATNARDADAITTLAVAENNLMAALSQLRIQIEAYPELKADRPTLNLMEELSSTENRIAFARQAYNDSVMTYNAKRLSFPTNVMAGMFGFSQANLFELQNPTEREAVRVNLTDSKFA